MGISPKAKIGKGVEIGHNIIIEDDAVIGDGTSLGHGSVIMRGTVLGNGCRIAPGAVLGKEPFRPFNSAVTSENDQEPLIVGDDCSVGVNAVVYRGALLRSKVFVADMATVRERVTVGEGTIIGRGVSVENDCTVGCFVKLETNSYITAYSTIGDRCFVAPCVTTSNDNYAGRTRERFKHFGGVTLLKGGRIGAGAVILPGVRIGEDALVGAGSLVTGDVPPRKIVYGRPARVIRDVPPEQLLENQEG